jgi:hypothetical protein
MSHINGLQDEEDEHYDDIPEYTTFAQKTHTTQTLSYNDGKTIGSAGDDTTEFERGGGMRVSPDSVHPCICACS